MSRGAVPSKKRPSKKRPSKTTWDESDFDGMSWHDVSVHGVVFREGPNQGEDGLGEVTFDLDSIVEWILEGNAYSFRIAPALLTFHEAWAFRIALDYGAWSAPVAPFVLDGITRTPGRYLHRWTIETDWPKGVIELEARGFTQRLTGGAVRTGRQVLTQEERRRAQDEGPEGGTE